MNAKRAKKIRRAVERGTVGKPQASYCIRVGDRLETIESTSAAVQHIPTIMLHPDSTKGRYRAVKAFCRRVKNGGHQ